MEDDREQTILQPVSHSGDNRDPSGKRKQEGGPEESTEDYTNRNHRKTGRHITIGTKRNLLGYQSKKRDLIKTLHPNQKRTLYAELRRNISVYLRVGRL